MPKSPLHDIRIVGAYNTRQAIRLEGQTSETVIADAIRGALADAGIDAAEVDGIIADPLDPNILSTYFIPLLGGQPCWYGSYTSGVGAVLQAACAIAAGLCNVVVIAAGQAGSYTERGSTAPWTRPNHQFTAPFGLYTAVEFALVAQRHMYLYGTSQRQLAEVAATIRNNGHINPQAVYFGRGPFSPEDVIASRPICSPFHLLDCSTTSEGGGAVVVVRADRAQDCARPAITLLGAGTDAVAQGYTRAPVWDEVGWIGQRAAERAFGMCGLRPADVDVVEFYDPFSFEIIRQFEAFGFCEKGEGGAFVMGGRIGLQGEFPIVTDGGTMSFSHSGSAQMIQRVIAAVLQLQGRCAERQVRDAEVAITSNGGGGALFSDVLLLGREAA